MERNIGAAGVACCYWGAKCPATRGEGRLGAVCAPVFSVAARPPVKSGVTGVKQETEGT